MTVKEFIKKLENLGYDDETVINFGSYNFSGEWFTSEIEDMDAEEINDNKYPNKEEIYVALQLSDGLKQEISWEYNQELEEDLREIIHKYCL